MNAISKETNIGFGIIFSISIWGVIDGRIPYWFLFVVVGSYLFMWIMLKIFIWDREKRKSKKYE